MSNLPNGWTRSTLGEVCDSGQYGWTCKATESGEVKFLRTTDITKGAINWASVPYCDEPPENVSKYQLYSGDIVISRAGSVGFSKLLESVPENTVFASYLIRFKPSAVVDSRYVFAYLNSYEYWTAIGSASSGIALANVNASKLAALSIPVAPLPEQKRIADKLDSVLARVDACRDRLDRLPALLKRFRQSILAAATSGRLTEDWRTDDMPNWTHERAGDVCLKVQSGGTPKEGFTDSGVPFLKVYNIVDQKVAFDYRPQFIDPAIHNKSMSKSQVQPGDVLMNIVGPPLGKVAVVPDTYVSWNINQAITLFRPSERITSGWLYCLLYGGDNISDIVHETKGSAGQTNISLSQCRDFIFPIPPISEQHEIVRRVETLFAFADRLEARLTSVRNQVEQLTPSLLAKAFRGDLVPQDPDDEPASELLKRIAAQRESAPQVKRGRRKAA